MTIKEWLENKQNLHFTLIDPDKQKPEDAAEIASVCEGYGTDAIMIGGSTINYKITDATTRAIRKKVGLPLILFPNSANAISPHAGYIFFMSLLNSNNRRFLVGEQLEGVAILKKMKIKPIPMAYIVISTSKKETTVEKVSNLDRIGKNEIEKAVNYALLGQYFGMECIYLEAGSGAEKPVSGEMIKAVRSNVNIPLIVGGGIRDGKTAKKKIDAGADIIVTGTIVEENTERIEEIISAIKQ